MSLSYYDGRERPESGLVNVLMAVNVGLALAALFFWTGVAYFVAEPLKWATWVGISPSPGFLEYPYILSWGLPLLGTAGCWLASKAKLRGVSLFLGFYPALFLALMTGWYYLAPVAWR